MTITYTKIVSEARRRLSPNFFTVAVTFEYHGGVTFRIALALEKGDDIIHMHDVKERECGLIEAIVEATRRCNFDNGRAEAFEPVLVGNHGRPEAVLPLSHDCPEFDPIQTGN